jgi:serine/threonine-protein kinase RsbW
MEIAFRLAMPRDASSVPAVRRLLGSTMSALGVEGDCINDVQVAVAEACTNVLKHALDSNDAYQVELELDHESVRISVTDSGHGFDHGSFRSDAELARESGRGILIMQALVDAVEFESEPRAGTIVHLTKGLRLQPWSFLRTAPAGAAAMGKAPRRVISIDPAEVSDR